MSTDREQKHESDTSVEEQKRKREENFEIFRKNRKMARSPYKGQTISDMDTLKNMMKEMLGKSRK